MSEYLSKKAVLEWLKKEASSGDSDIRNKNFNYGLEYVMKNIQSGAFDADDLIGDRIDEKCPKCGSYMLANKVGDKWCSLVGCDYSINSPEKVGTEEGWHKHYGAEWSEVEGDEKDA